MCTSAVCTELGSKALAASLCCPATRRARVVGGQIRTYVWSASVPGRCVFPIKRTHVIELRRYTWGKTTAGYRDERKFRHESYEVVEGILCRTCCQVRGRQTTKHRILRSALRWPAEKFSRRGFRRGTTTPSIDLHTEAAAVLLFPQTHTKKVTKRKVNCETPGFGGQAQDKNYM